MLKIGFIQTPGSDSRSYGIPLAFGSDGMPLDPLYGIRSAMNHPTATERLDFTEALSAYTLTAASAGCIDHLTGSLEPGKQADLVILSADPAEKADVKVDAVFVAGEPQSTTAV